MTTKAARQSALIAALHDRLGPGFTDIAVEECSRETRVVIHYKAHPGVESWSGAFVYMPKIDYRRRLPEGLVGDIIEAAQAAFVGGGRDHRFTEQAKVDSMCAARAIEDRARD